MSSIFLSIDLSLTFFYLSHSLSIYLSLFSLSLSFSSPVFHVFRFSLSLSLILSLTFGKIVPFIPENIGFNLTYTVTRIHRLCWFSRIKGWILLGEISSLLLRASWVMKFLLGTSPFEKDIEFENLHYRYHIYSVFLRVKRAPSQKFYLRWKNYPKKFEYS